jgi:hypothetical protein
MSPDTHDLKRDPSFRWLMAGAFMSLMGDQFTLIALPWLVLRMTGDPLALGTALALVAVPRAVFILIGGALVDRHSPKRVMMLTKHANTLLLGILAALVLTNGVTLPAVYALSLAIGLASAFSIPAGTSMLPHVVAPRHLQAANGMMMGLRQVTMFIGPLIAGVLIAVFGDGGKAGLADAKGLGIAFAIDALTFALSAWTLSRVAMRPSPAAATSPEPVLKAVAAGIRTFWADRHLRLCFAYWSAVALLIIGPIHIALPLLASTQLHGDAAAFGILIGAHGAGTLAGMVLSSMFPSLKARSFGLTILVVDALVGALFIPMGQVTAPWQGAGLLLAIGVLGGFIQVAVFTWIQLRVAPAMLGRAMSLFMFIFMGLTPVSAAFTGWLLRSVPLNTVFVGSGALLIGMVLLALVATQLPKVPHARPEAA